MYKIKECTEEDIQKLPNIFDLIYEHFGLNSVNIYLLLNEINELAFLVEEDNKFLYITEHGYKSFITDEHLNIKYLKDKDLEIYYDSITAFVDKDKNEYSIEFYPLDEPDSEGYTGEVIFNQYHPSTDTLCRLTYQQMYRDDGNNYIYTYHTRKPNFFYIEEENSKNHDTKLGIIHPKVHMYGRTVFDRYSLGYNMLLVNRYGISAFLNQNSRELEYQESLEVFTQAKFISFAGYARDLWPLCRLYQREELEKYLEENNFKTSIPIEMIDYYNKEDNDLKNIRIILEEIPKQENYEKSISLKLKEINNN